MCSTITIRVSAGVLREHVAHEFELGRVQPSLVFAGGIRLGLVGAEIVDVVEHQEQRLRIEEGVIVRPEHPLVGLAAAAPVGGLEVEVVIAADVPPGQADRADDRVVAVVERQVVEHDVAGREAEPGFRPRERLDHVLADEVDFDVRFRLRVGEHHDLERSGFVLPAQREIDRSGQGAGRRRRPRR